MMKKLFVRLITAFIIFTYLQSAENTIRIPKTDTPPKLDGILDDPAWEKASKFDAFKTFKPDYGKKPDKKTIFYVTYDSHNLYFAIKAFDEPSGIKTSVTKRDHMFNDDWVGILIDTFNNAQSAYGFFLNPSGIQGDGMTTINGEFNETQDFVWYGAGKINKEGYCLEYKIPLKSLRFPSGKKVIMRIMAIRNITRFSENDSFPPIYPDKGSVLSQTLPVEFENLKFKRVFELLPDVVHNNSKEIKSGELVTSEKNTEFGLTTKLGITSDLTLDAAYNPDFSQVEADAGQVDINLRYDLFYPEKRPFFQEGSELFKFAGNTEEAPLWAVVHTRRIISPLYGIKLSGKITQKDTVLGLFAKDQISDGDIEITPFYSIVRYMHSLKEDSYIGGFFTSKDNNGYFNRILGSDGRIRINESSFAEYHYFGSITSDGEGIVKNTGHALGVRYQFLNRKYILDTGIQDISDSFQIDTGFITRTGIIRFALFGMYQLYPESKIFKKIDTLYWSFHIYDKEYKTFETFNLFALRFHLPLNSEFRIDGRLGNEVFRGEKFDKSGFDLRINSQITKRLFFSLSLKRSGKIFYDPESPYQGYGNTAFFYIQFQPHDKLESSLSLIYSDFYKKSTKEKIYDYSILRNKTTFQINKYLFFRGIVEYNNYWKKLTVDALASFTYIPGTVVYIGYGSVFNKIRWNYDEYVPSENFLETKRGFFFKVSYLYRY